MELATAFDNLPTELGDHDVIAWGFNPKPYALPRQLGLDLETTEKIMHTAGLGGLIVQECTSATNTPCSVSLEHGDSPTRFDWPIATIALNKPWIDVLANEHTHRGRKGPLAGAIALNAALRTGLRRAATQNLVTHPFKQEWLPLLAFATAETAVNAEGPLAVAGTWAAFQAVSAGANILMHRGDSGVSETKKFRSSILPFGPQLDRLAAVIMRLQTRDFIYPVQRPANYDPTRQQA